MKVYRLTFGWMSNERYANFMFKSNKSFGVCTLETQHIQVKPDKVDGYAIVDFIGKE